ncbi:ferredoxin [Segniliparus rotundus DSM 44985]|uniref:Ferredoxin n=1 Tax=Segniliparus rotundus (strain ATCC BAA-972 / CDC 1076 / CIP 108378 / DSM 44985 / JCM 13578) TaxID=640132 RepID=D6Z9Y6_SEGRD|nr:ferredoxin reductase [Segniliparus rotundus]ADG98656.1 ferredoxin [Segniliparus rotundus DSM 44985]
MGIRAWLEKPAQHIPARNWGVNMVRGAVARLSHPLLPDDYAQLFNPLWSARELRGQIIDVRPETADSTTLVIRPGWGFDPRFAPGQHVGVGVRIEGRWVWRSYSLTSVPAYSVKSRAMHAPLSVTVRAVPEGRLSSHLTSGVRPGTVIRLQAPAGDFHLPEPPPPKILFITAGSGITPVMSMLRHLARRDMPVQVAHVHSERTEQGVIFGQELREFGQKFLSLAFHLQITSAQGRLDEQRLSELVPDWRERQTWACGPAELLEALAAWWTAAGVPERLKTEQFALRRTGPSEGAGSGALGGVVRFARSDKEVVSDGATTILEAGESAGLVLPFGCRMGICHTCSSQLSQGTVCDLRNGNLHEEGERIQTCCTAPVGNCVIDL